MLGNVHYCGCQVAPCRECWQIITRAVTCIAGGEVGANAEAAKGSNEGKVGGFKDIMGGSTGGISDLKGAVCLFITRQAG